jgi:hypothetical protein
LQNSIRGNIVTLAEAIAEFSTKNSHLSDPDGAYLMCDRVSAAFVGFCLQNQIESARTYGFDVVPCYDFDDSNPNPDPEFYVNGLHDTHHWRVAVWHCIVETPEFFVDFTARQYRSTCAFPLIIPKKAAAAAAGGN